MFKMFKVKIKHAKYKDKDVKKKIDPYKLSEAKPRK